MTSITAVTLNALANDQARIERVATNLANLQTPGYKRELVVERSAGVSPFAQAVEALQQDAALPQATGPQVGVASIVRDLRAGTLKPTGRALDLALAGSGFFEVATEHGPAYTRRGEFQVDARGRLATAEGHALMGSGGEITLSGNAPRIDADGKVFDGERQVGQLRLVDASETPLRALGGGLFAADGAVREMPAGQVAVRQGHLENANVDTAHEMVSLSTSVRHFEALLRVAQGRDEMLGTAIRKLGDA